MFELTMKLTTILAAMAILGALAACTQPDKPRKIINEETENVVEPTALTVELFKDKIMDFEEHPEEWVFKGERPAVIDFYATWCGPCKATAPIVAELAAEYKDEIDFYKVDIDQQPELAQLFGVQSIPTFLFIPQKGMPQTAVGAMDRTDFEEAIKKVILTKQD